MKASVFSIVFRMILVKKFTIPKIQLSGFRKMCTLRSVASPETQVSFPGKCDASSTIFLLIKISIKICFVRYFFPIKRYFHLYSCICYINGALKVQLFSGACRSPHVHVAMFALGSFSSLQGNLCQSVDRSIISISSKFMGVLKLFSDLPRFDNCFGVSGQTM